MAKYRRIEITAFRRRVTITSVNHRVNGVSAEQVVVNDGESSDAIDISYDDGQEILIEAVRLLEKKISKQTRPEIRPPDPSTFNNAPHACK